MRTQSWPFVVLLLVGASTGSAADPVFRSDFGRACLNDRDWRVSGRLAEGGRADRVRCLGAGGERALAITVKPGDAYDPNPGSAPTERVEIQLQRELVRFDRPVWYSFRFKVEEPWLERHNRTVIHQIKQNIDPRFEKGRGGLEICDAANPLFKIEVDSDGSRLVFRAKVAGSESCGDSLGQSVMCGDWPIDGAAWHRVHVMIRPSQRPGESRLRLWLDKRACPGFDGLLGYPRYGTTRDGEPVIDTQPRFGIYRDALPGRQQTILFDEIAFWSEQPKGDAGWAGIDTAP